ncbi:MAG: hypothetical protein K6G51_05005 [Sphaerochaetaceae bacterium]|nr:hypothetical protein [Sphaerochaetaceae bacterium]
MSGYEMVLKECNYSKSLVIKNQVLSNELYSTYIFSIVIDSGKAFNHVYYSHYTDKMDFDDLEQSRILNFKTIKKALSAIGFILDCNMVADFESGHSEVIKIGK